MSDAHDRQEAEREARKPQVEAPQVASAGGFEMADFTTQAIALAGLDPRFSGEANEQRRAASLRQIHRQQGNRAVGQMVGGGFLDAPVRRRMESAFGKDFGAVRIHEDAEANSESNSRALTMGEDIYFAPGQFDPRSRRGSHLLAHELAHVVQQQSARGRAPLTKRGDATEAAAETAARAVTLGQKAPPLAPAGLGPARYDPPVLEFSEEESGDVDVMTHADPGIPPTTVTTTNLRDWSALAISDYEEAANQGLEDFEHQVGSSFDWISFGANVLGNLVWACAAFETGGAAFVISVAGIAIGSTATTAGALGDSFDMGAFHTAARQKISEQIVPELQARIGPVVSELHPQVVAGGWTEHRARQELLRRFVNSTRYIRDLGGVPMLNKAAVSARMEADLLIKASTTRWRDFLGWEHGNCWLEYSYTIDNVFSAEREANLPSEWRKSLTRVWIFPLGNRDLPSLNARLNTIYQSTLREPMQPATWPIRKRVSLLLRPMVGTVTLDLSPAGAVTSAMHTVPEMRLRRMGIDASEEAEFPAAMLRWVWEESGGRPVDIDGLFMSR